MDIMNTDEVKDLYTKKASLYHRFFIDFLGWGRKLEKFFWESSYLHPNLKILDAGCGTGIVTRTLYTIAREKRYHGIIFHAFDLTPAMLSILQQWITNEGAQHITIQQADILNLKIPSDWTEYDLIISSAMLEYVPKDTIRQALNNLKQLLKPGGTLLIFITRRNVVTKLFVELWWKANIYAEQEVEQILQDVGFSELKLMNITVKWFSSMIIVEAKK